MRSANIALVASAAAVAATLAFAAPQPAPLSPPPPPGTGLKGGECFRSHDIRNHTVADDHTMLLDVNGRTTYRVTMRGGCFAAYIPSDPIVTREPPGSSMICKPIDMDVAVSRNGFETRCIVDSIVRMTPEEVAALPKRLKP